jgi:hypothetical protein
MYSFGFHGISPSDTMIPYVALFMQGYITAIFSISIFLPPFIMELGRPPLETRKRGIPDLNKTRP